MSNFFQIFINDTSLWNAIEILFRTTFMYCYAVLNIRLLDKRSIGQLSSYEIIIIIALGSAVGDPMFYQNIPLIHGMLVITTIVLLEHLLAKLVDSIPFIHNLIIGSPVLLIKNGVVNRKILKKEDITYQELLSNLRLKGVENTGEIAFAYLETNGSISVIKAQKITSGDSTIIS